MKKLKEQIEKYHPFDEQEMLGNEQEEKENKSPNKNSPERW